MLGVILEGRGCCRWRALEVASFVPGHVRNRGATPWSWTALCSKRNKVATPFHSNLMDRRLHDDPCAGARTCALEPHRTARPARRARARRLPRPNLTRFRITTDYACQDVSAAAEKRARWNCRWHPTTASPMDDCCSLLVASLARAGRAGAHSSVPMATCS